MFGINYVLTIHKINCWAIFETTHRTNAIFFYSKKAIERFISKSDVPWFSVAIEN